jgi:hypothetical protein
MAAPEEQAPPSSTTVLQGQMGRGKRRLMIGVGAAALVTVVAAIAYWQATKSDLPDPPAKDLAGVQSVDFATIDKEHHIPLASQALSELEKDRLPKALVEALARVSHGFREQRTISLMEAFLDPTVAAEWTKTCPAGPSALAEMSRLDRLRQARFLYEKCDLARIGFLTADEANPTDGVLLATSYVIYDFLSRHRALLPTEERLLRAMLKDSLADPAPRRPSMGRDSNKMLDFVEPPR